MKYHILLIAIEVGTANIFEMKLLDVCEKDDALTRLQEEAKQFTEENHLKLNLEMTGDFYAFSQNRKVRYNFTIINGELPPDEEDNKKAPE